MLILNYIFEGFFFLVVAVGIIIFPNFHNLARISKNFILIKYRNFSLVQMHLHTYLCAIIAIYIPFLHKSDNTVL